MIVYVETKAPNTLYKILVGDIRHSKLFEKLHYLCAYHKMFQTLLEVK